MHAVATLPTKESLRERVRFRRDFQSRKTLPMQADAVIPFIRTSDRDRAQIVFEPSHVAISNPPENVAGD